MNFPKHGAKFHDFPGLEKENEIPCMTFPGFLGLDTPWTNVCGKARQIRSEILHSSLKIADVIISVEIFK